LNFALPSTDVQVYHTNASRLADLTEHQLNAVE
jgi:hypothetical protein